jgi:hypothetical protein
VVQASRVGDVERVKYLVQREAVDVNKRDRWDSVPLYYACLAGSHGVWSRLLHTRFACRLHVFMQQVVKRLHPAPKVTQMLRRCCWSMAQYAMSGHSTVSLLAFAPVTRGALEGPHFVHAPATSPKQLLVSHAGDRCHYAS